MTAETPRTVHRYDDHTPEEWEAAINAMRSGETFECDESFFDYFLEVLPPARMGYRAKLPNGDVIPALFGFAEGAEEIVAFWRTGKESEGTVRYFGCRTNEINPHA